MPKKYNLTRTQFCESFLYLDGKKYSVQKDYPHMLKPMNSTAQEIVLKFSRQTAKSTTLAMATIADSTMIPFFRTLYVAPTVDQSKVFSGDRVAPVLEYSPFIKKNYINSRTVQNVHLKQLTNGSKIYLRYALLGAEKLRGYSADKNIFDETQDLLPSVLDIVNETMNRSDYKYTVYAGTPKRSKGTLATLWNRSDQQEYIIKCDHCGKWNILDEGNIGLTGVICKNCGKKPDLKKGQWVSTYSQTKAPSMEGYRICALHFADAPWVNWQKDIIQKRDNRPRAVFYNETLALEYDSGVAPITELELQASCNHKRLITLDPDELDKSYKSVTGIDYGPTNSENSNTVIAVVQRRPGKYVVTYAKKFLGKEADYAFIHSEVPRLMDIWKSSHLAADYGMGEASNSEIRSRIGYERVVAFQHEQNQKEIVKWNPNIPAFTLSRTKIMQKVFEAIKKGKIEFPRWEYFKPFAEDILNIQAEYDEVLGKTKFVNIGPDDFFHALIYAIISLDMINGPENSLLNIMTD